MEPTFEIYRTWHRVRLVHCRSCSAPMIWTVTANGKKMPVDADPIEATRGFRLDVGEDPPVATFTAAPEVGERLYQSHYATCPQADDWRKP